MQSTPTEWRPIPGWEALYEASADGSIRSSPSSTGRGRKPGHVLRSWPHRSGYLYVSLYRGQQRRNVKVHQLVASAFYGPRPAGKVTRHLNGEQTDNRVQNLRWGTQLENAWDRDRHGRTRIPSRTPERNHP